MRKVSTVIKRYFFCLIVLMFIVGCTVKDRKPNIILIVTDDQGYADLSAYKHASQHCSTPNMDHIADNGVLFTHAYATAPVCSPSRAALYTGKYQERWDSLMYWSPGLPENVSTLAEILKDAEYVTAKIGKSDFGIDYHNPDVREFPTNHGYDYFLGFSSHAHDYFLLDKEIEIATPDPYGWSAALGRLFRDTSKVSFEDSYTTNLFTDEAISFIRKHKDQPFFLDLSYNAVHHLIHEVPQAYLDKWNVKKIPNYDPSYGTYADYYWDYTQVNKISDEEMRRYYLANLNCLDDNIGRLLDTLEELDLTENTLIIFISDNGGEPLAGANNLPLSGSKYTMYEGGIRVPFMLSWPERLPEGKVYHHRVSALDIVPTSINAAGIEHINLEQLDGASILEAVKNNEPAPAAQKPLYFKFGDHYAIIDGPWKLVYTYNYNPSNRPITSQIILGKHSNQLALYNLKDDPGERHNLINQKPEKASALEKMAAIQNGEGALTGFHYYPRSDFAAYHRPKFSFFLKTISTRTLATESINRENLKGRLLNSGDAYLIVDGSEYYNLMPVWDWTKLPGVTGFEGADKIKRKHFAGSVGDGESGLTAMNYHMAGRDSTRFLSARKVWARH